MKIRLRVTIAIPEERVREFNLEYAGPQVFMGRDSENDIQIPLPSVSRKHARLFEENGQWFIEDIGSGSGTRINAELLQANHPRQVADSDIIEIVHATITVFLTPVDRLETDLDEKTSIVAQRMVRGMMDKSEQSDPYLIVLNGPSEGRKTAISNATQEFVIGRAETADLSISDASLSRRHARITREWNDIYIEDLGSKNGVVVNGRKISNLTRIKDGDRIYLGTLHLAFMDPLANQTGQEMEQKVPGPEVDEPQKPIEKEAIRSPVAKRRKSVTSAIGMFEITLGILSIAVLAALVAAISKLT